MARCSSGSARPEARGHRLFLRGPVMHFDVIIIGSGLAGMAAALELAPRRHVALVSKGAL
ncbi:FAD-binding protein, partial [Achromobacter xylosoxidans]|uniref:FAD-binding protein n=1 Tax=Alcaligenes xylosoxydans xylosoxydans TaxID=85698 RepID=UPI003BF53D51